jgi:hypothetical protein
MRFAFGLPIGLVWVLGIGSSASMAASCPPRANKPSNWCLQSKGSTQPQSHQPGAGTQKRNPVHPDFSIPSVPPNPYGPVPVTRKDPPMHGVPVVLPDPNLSRRSPPSVTEPDPPSSSGRAAPSSAYRPGQDPEPGVETPADYLIVCWVDSASYCTFSYASPVPSGTSCSCGQQQGLTE